MNDFAKLGVHLASWPPNNHGHALYRGIEQGFAEYSLADHASCAEYENFHSPFSWPRMWDRGKHQTTGLLLGHGLTRTYTDKPEYGRATLQSGFSAYIRGKRSRSEVSV